MAHLGEWGRYQMFQMFLLMLASMTAGMHMLSLVTVAAIPEHRCGLSWLENDTSIGWGSEEVRSAIPLNPDGSLSSCFILDPVTNSSSACIHWVYNTTYYTSTRATQWNMVCDRRWMGALAQSVYMFGVFFGAISSGTLADKYGRKTVFCWSALFQLLVGTGIAFVNDYYVFLVGLFFYGIFGSAGAFVTAFVLIMELVGPSKRTVCGLVFQGMFAVGCMLVAAWASVIPNATLLQLIYGAHSLLIFGHWWLVDESPRWLWSQGRITESVNIVAKGVLFNKGPRLDRAHFISRGKAKADSEERQVAGLADLFKTPRLRGRSINIAFNWFANAMTFYGLSLNSNKMEGNPFFNMFVMALVEIPCYGMVIGLLDKTGRRSLTSSLMLVGGMACVITAFIPPELGDARTAVSFLGKFCIAGSFGIIYNYSAELFPTVVRNTGIGFGSMCARLGAMLTPTISLLDAIDKRIPTIVFASFSIVSGFFTLFLPETLNQPMPQTIEEGETFGVGDTAFANGCGGGRKEKETTEYLDAKPV